MTQHKWITTDGWECMAGFDRVSQTFFFQADRSCERCNGEGWNNDVDQECDSCLGEGIIYLFNNLDSDLYVNALGQMTLEQVHDALKHYLASWPDGLLTALNLDRAAQAEPTVTKWGVIGSARSVRPV